MIGHVTILTASLAAFIAPRRHELSDKLTAYKHGATTGVKYTPVILTVMLTALYGATKLAGVFPVLKWGWADTNILMPNTTPQPTDTPQQPPPATTSVEQLTTTLTDVVLPGITITAFLITIIAVFLLLNHDEEQWGRGSWPRVTIWAASHVIMGIPVFAVIPIFAGGVVMQHIHNAHGFNDAYAAHVTVNTTFATIITAILIVNTTIL